MVTAYVLVKANTGEADRLLDDVIACSGVDDGHIVAGDVDIIARVDVDSPADVKGVVTDEINSVSGVESTRTYMAMD